MSPSSTTRIPRVTVDATVADALRAMRASGVGGALVVDRVGVVGLVTAEGVASAGTDLERPVTDFVTFEVVRIDPDDDLVTTVRTYQHAAQQSAVRRRVGDRSHA